jgi:hypothetical protein
VRKWEELYKSARRLKSYTVRTGVGRLAVPGWRTRSGRRFLKNLKGKIVPILTIQDKVVTGAIPKEVRNLTKFPWKKWYHRKDALSIDEIHSAEFWRWVAKALPVTTIPKKAGFRRSFAPIVYLYSYGANSQKAFWKDKTLERTFQNNDWRTWYQKRYVQFCVEVNKENTETL